jgi:hypothetical protein
VEVHIRIGPTAVLHCDRKFTANLGEQGTTLGVGGPFLVLDG